MADRETTPWFVPLNPSYSLSALQTVHRRLHLFSWVMPAPKEGDGDSLQIAFRVGDSTLGLELLARLGLKASYELQRPSDGPFAGATVQAFVQRCPLGLSGDPRRDAVVARLRLWNEDAIYDVTWTLVEQAALIEDRLFDMGAASVPRETQLLSWITRERYPECFAT